MLSKDTNISAVTVDQMVNQLAKAYVATFPAEGAELKAQLSDMAAKVKERKTAK